MTTKIPFLVSALIFSQTAAAFSFGPAIIKSASLEEASGKKAVTIDMLVDEAFADLAVLRVPKKAGNLASAKVTSEDLAYCKVVGINQSSDSVIADVIVSFEPENDGGYNSCSLTIDNGAKKLSVQLGAEVGE